jgi:hypothetical protein
LIAWGDIQFDRVPICTVKDKCINRCAQNILKFIYFECKCAAQAARDVLDSLVRGNESDNNLPE